jgi:hypothetical protein
VIAEALPEAGLVGEVDGDLLAGQGAELLPGPAPLLVGLAGDDQLPVGQVDAGGRSRRQDREVLDQVLARRQLDAGTFPSPLEPTRHRAHLSYSFRVSRQDAGIALV